MVPGATMMNDTGREIVTGSVRGKGNENERGKENLPAEIQSAIENGRGKGRDGKSEQSLLIELLVTKVWWNQQIS